MKGLTEPSGKCVFCGGDEYWSRTSTSFGSDPSYTEHTCRDCKSVRRVENPGRETWHRSGHPLSYRLQEQAK